MAMVVMATLQQRKCDRQQFATTNLMYPPLHLLLSTRLVLRTRIFHCDAVSSEQIISGSGSGLTCPHSSSPTPMNTHHSHWSMVRAVHENGFPPNWTMMI